MTHPQAALGYLASKEMKFLFDKAGVSIMITQEATVIADSQEVRTVKKEERPAPPPEEEEVFKLSGMFGFSKNNALKERLAYEKAQAEEYRRLRDG